MKCSIHFIVFSTKIYILIRLAFNTFKQIKSAYNGFNILLFKIVINLLCLLIYYVQK